LNLEMLEYIEATQPSGMPMMRKKASPGVAGALDRKTTILVGPTKLAEPQLRRDSSARDPYLVVAKTEGGHGAGETNPVVIGMTGL
jgi:hypothetical protein